MFDAIWDYITTVWDATGQLLEAVPYLPQLIAIPFLFLAGFVIISWIRSR